MLFKQKQIEIDLTVDHKNGSQNLALHVDNMGFLLLKKNFYFSKAEQICLKFFNTKATYHKPIELMFVRQEKNRSK